MRKMIFKRSECKSYKDFYERVYAELGSDIPDVIGEYENLHYNADILNEYLWYMSDENIHFVFIGFDLEAIKTKRPYENYEWALIFEIINDLVKDYPNNKVEYIDKLDE